MSSPQVHTLPSPRSAIEWLIPPETIVTSVNPCTWTGSGRFVLVPSPSSPDGFEPHDHTVPSFCSASACHAPSEIEAMPWLDITYADTSAISCVLPVEPL